MSTQVPLPTPDAELVEAICRLLTVAGLDSGAACARVESGHVTLTGSVAGWSVRDATERSVRSLIGVTGLTNRLLVDPDRLAWDLQRAIHEARACPP